MASKLSFCASVVLFSLGLLSVGIAVSISANVNQRPRSLSENQQCVPFEHHYCSKFGYSSTVSPNPWARHLSLEQAKAEFEDFSSLLQNNCSSKLGVFLCFTYFPLCYENPLGPRQVILPCKEICDEVHASGCNDLVVNSAGQWAQHLQCSNFKPKSESQNGNCAGSSQDSTSEREGALPTVYPPATTEGVEEVTTTEMETNMGCEGQKCRPTCNVRPKSTRRTFKTNSYTFAAKVQILHKLANSSHCKHAYRVEVIQQFNLSSLKEGRLTYAPTMTQHSIIHTNPYKCNVCPNLIDGSCYLIAGQYNIDVDGTVMWELPNAKSESLVSEWIGKNGENYDKKLSSWIADANENRL